MNRKFSNTSLSKKLPSYQFPKLYKKRKNKNLHKKKQDKSKKYKVKHFSKTNKIYPKTQAKESDKTKSTAKWHSSQQNRKRKKLNKPKSTSNNVNIQESNRLKNLVSAGKKTPNQSQKHIFNNKTQAYSKRKTNQDKSKNYRNPKRYQRAFKSIPNKKKLTKDKIDMLPITENKLDLNKKGQQKRHHERFARVKQKLDKTVMRERRKQKLLKLKVKKKKIFKKCLVIINQRITNLLIQKKRIRYRVPPKCLPHLRKILKFIRLTDIANFN